MVIAVGGATTGIRRGISICTSCDRALLERRGAGIWDAGEDGIPQQRMRAAGLQANFGAV
jgi:ribosomal protein L37AE/L43A